MMDYDVLYASDSRKRPVRRSFKATDDEHMRLRVIAEMKKQGFTTATVTRSYIDNLGLGWTDEWESITFRNGIFRAKSLYFDEPAYVIDLKTGDTIQTKPKKKTR